MPAAPPVTRATRPSSVPLVFVRCSCVSVIVSVPCCTRFVSIVRLCGQPQGGTRGRRSPDTGAVGPQLTVSMRPGDVTTDSAKVPPMADLGPLATALRAGVVKGTRGTSKRDAELRVGGPVHRAIGIREKPDGPPRPLVPAPTGQRS